MFCQLTHDLQQQGTFAGPRMAADQDRRAMHQPAAQHPVQLVDTGTDAGQLLQVNILECLHFRPGSAGITLEHRLAAALAGAG